MQNIEVMTCTKTNVCFSLFMNKVGIQVETHTALNMYQSHMQVDVHAVVCVEQYITLIVDCDIPATSQRTMFVGVVAQLPQT